MKRLVALGLIALFCLPLAGCDELAKNTKTVLKACDIAYKGVMDGSAIAFKQGFITKDTLARVAHIAAIYHSSWDAACVALEEYKTAEESGDSVNKEVKRIALNAAVSLAKSRLEELNTYWREAKNAYTELKEKHDE
ncbi:hypothetical protein [Halodesulfovibrio aestuarii]|uniref:Lipoprotein n=1 Tax=Halodesulfovibrio aestuarii TaxID=126333 RepID=A0ABV4JW73_9BACT